MLKPRGNVPPAPGYEASEISAERVDDRLLTFLAPDSPDACQYQIVALRLEELAAGGLRSILFTSALAGEGKTTVAANSAFALASRSKRRVLFVDANLAAPRVHSFFGLPAGNGLRQVLAHGQPLDAVIWQFGSSRLSILPAGQPMDDTTGSVVAPDADELFATLTRRFDLVVLDGPPLLVSADTRWLASRAEGILLIVRARRTPRHQVRHAIQALGDGRLLGSIVNDVERGMGAPYRVPICQAYPPSGTSPATAPSGHGGR